MFDGLRETIDEIERFMQKINIYFHFFLDKKTKQKNQDLNKKAKMKHSARKDLKTYRLNLFLRFELFIYERLFIEWSF